MSSFNVVCGVSGTVKSAQSKKCNLLKLVRGKGVGSVEFKVACVKLEYDGKLLKDILSVEMLRASAEGEVVEGVRGSRAKSVVVRINLD